MFLAALIVPVMPHAALWARPLAHIQGKGVEHMPAGMAAFGTGIPAVNRDQRAPVPGHLVFQLADQFTLAYLADALGQLRVADQVLDGQRLDTDRLVLVN